MADPLTPPANGGAGLVRRLSLEASHVPSVRVVDTDPTHNKREWG